MQLWRWLLNLRVCMWVKSAVVNGGGQSSNLCHAMDHSRAALVALGWPHRIDWGNNEQMHVKLKMEPNPKAKELQPKGVQLNERFWRGARLLHSRSGVGYMHLVFCWSVSSSTRNYEMITKGKMLLLYIIFSQLILFFDPSSANSDQKQFSPNNIHTLSRDKVMRINKMITIEKIPWPFIKFSQLILKGDVWRSVWRICMWILGLKGLRIL